MAKKNPETGAPSTGPFDLVTTAVHLDSNVHADNPAVPIPSFTHDEKGYQAYVEAHCAPGAAGHLISRCTTTGDWPSWECHPEGDEVVIVTAGRAVFLQEIDDEERRTEVGPGDAVINPAGVWHTADVREPLEAIYITPCPGTRHRPR